jgi:predicted GNAT superfamily acetyltransferase
VAASAGRPGLSEFSFRRLGKPEELRAAEEVQALAARASGDPGVPVPLQRAFQDNGGLVVGAFVDIHLAGVSAGFLGWDGETLFHYAHATAVRPEYQNHHVGFRLRAFEREEVLRAGLSQIRWTVDPLVSRSAFVSLRRLGGVADRYYVHYYGRGGPAAESPEETDRLRLIWRIATPAVEARLSGAVPSPSDDERRQRGSQPIVETETNDHGLRVPTSVTEPSGGPATIEIPFDLALHREHDPASVRTWRHASRDAFRAAFDLGYQVDDFAVVTTDHERRSFYLLSPRPEGTKGASPDAAAGADRQDG